MLPFQIDVRTQIDDTTNGPAQTYSYGSAKDSHYTRLCEEQSLYIGITGPNRLHDANFTAPFEDGHHQGVNDSDGSDGQREAAEDSQKKIKHGEKLPQVLGGIHDREGIETHLLDRLFDGLNELWAFHSPQRLCRWI